MINLLFTANWLDARITAKLKPFNLSPIQYNILRILRGNAPECCSLNTLRDRMIEKRSDLSRVVERLFKSGLVEKNFCKDNKRELEITITNRGMEVLKEIDVMEGEFFRFINNLDNSDAQKLNELLEKIRA
jgi:DNA-binding MarR family transcriptional regulator